VSFEQIFTGRDVAGEKLRWTSVYGSVTFSSMGQNFIDGGYNEAGLYIQEMTLEGGALPAAGDGRPRVFMTLWMQYVLDNFTSVDDVIKSLSEISIDGWPWHFFVSDSQGGCSCIDFVNGDAKIYSEDTMPYPVMTNYEYPQELDELKSYLGFGGDCVVDLNDLGDIEPPRNTRFIHACHLIENASKHPDVDEAFNILYAMDRGSLRPPGGRHWSYVIDVAARRVHVETRTSPTRRHFDLDDFDFADGKPSQLIDIHVDAGGDVGLLFEDVTPDSNRAALNRCVAWWADLFASEIENMQSRGEEVADVYIQGSWAVAADGMAAHAEEVMV
jgi:penicillin V acylase-like amidase (Ntn superfamily)